MAKHTEKPVEENQETINNHETTEECFIITPIGAFGSEVYSKAMGLIDAIIDPVLREMGMMAMPANRMQDLGSINKQLIKRVIEDRLVIANLTGLNPNVMYELAIRHGARKPVIIMAEEDTRLPFDITDQRTIFYSDTLSGVEKAKDELRKKITFALVDENPDNPIYSYLESAKLFREIKDDDPLKLILEKFDDLSSRMDYSSNKLGYRRPASYENLVDMSNSSLFKISGNVDVTHLAGEKKSFTHSSAVKKISDIFEMYLVPYSKSEILLRDLTYLGASKFEAIIYCNSENILRSIITDLNNDGKFSDIRVK